VSGGRSDEIGMISQRSNLIMLSTSDSVILHLKGKQIGNLQSYHHAGALICMWIAYRYQSQPVWVFCVFNAGVHTFMYAYYFCSALRLPFPKRLKRNLTTLQILQIASGECDTKKQVG
jgi:hypothetical protein